jgi:urease accessory protein
LSTNNTHTSLLRLLQLADSALPIGSTAHSFGLETLIAEGILVVQQLEQFLSDYMQETGRLEAIFCRQAHQLAQVTDESAFLTCWLALNDRLSAFKVARESRTASATLGRRFLQLVCGLTASPRLATALQSAKAQRRDIHYCLAFGLVSSILDIDETLAVLAYLQQVLTSQVSACQRLLPLGQTQASAILWQLKPVLLEVAEASATQQWEDECAVFTPLPDIASMRHPNLPTRLFIS